MMSPHTVEELLFHMPAVEREVENAWAKGFAASIRRQSRRRDWQPSPKQIGMMRRLVSEMFMHCAEPGDVIIMEDDD